MRAVRTSEKYEAAIAWCDKNKHLLPPMSKHRLMKMENLYAMLDQFGVRWSPSNKLWFEATDKPAAVIQSAPSGRVLIRMIAHRDLIEKRVAELIELSEALNWIFVQRSNEYEASAGDFSRVYLTFRVTE